MAHSGLAGSTKKPRSPGKMRASTEQVKTKSVEPHTRFALPGVNWDELNEPGAYVQRGSGDLCRVPKEAIIPGGSPIIHKEIVATRASQQEPICNHPRGTAALCAAQHRSQLLKR